MKTLSAWLGILFFSVIYQMVYAVEHSELRAFPPAKPGMQRLVIVLPHKERGEDLAFKVELVPGKEMMTDGVNHMALNYSIETRPLPGWGYDYYEITGTDQAMSTLMGVAPGTPPVKRFVNGRSTTIAYNSRLPIVIYAPQGVEVKYRIWRADETFGMAVSG